MDMINRFKFFSRLTLLTFFSLFICLPAQATTFQNPIVVDDAYIATNGNTITGNYQGTLTQAAITINTQQSVIISNAILQGPGDLIQALTVPANINVSNTIGMGTNPNVRGKQKGIFLHVAKFANISMKNNNVNGVRLGFYCNGYAGDFTTDNTLVIDYNVFTNIDARPSDGIGAYETTGQYNGQAVHLGNLVGVPGIDIGYNEITNAVNISSTGALIEVNESSGTLTSVLLIHDNFISGAFPTYPGRDLFNFGAILINGEASDTAKNASSFIHVTTNSVVATANYGIAVVAGHDVLVDHNRVVSSGYGSTNNVFYPMSTYGDAAGGVNVNLFNQPATVFFNNYVENNLFGLIKNNGQNKPVRNDWNLPGQSTSVSATNHNFTPNDSTDPTVADEANELAFWLSGVADNNITVGLTTDVGYQDDSQPLTVMAPISSSASGTYVLNHVKITNPNGDCISISGNSTSQVIITNSVIGPCTNGRGIHVAGVTSTLIQNNLIHDVSTQGISVELVPYQSVLHNSIENGSAGVYIANNNGNVVHAKVDFNSVTNMNGRANASSSGIQLNQISGPNNSISCNLYTQTAPPPSGLPGINDAVSTYLSSGTASSPLQIVGNRVNGGGPLWNGGGLLLTDGNEGTGTTGPGYVTASDNLLINPGGFGIAVTTGHDVSITGNYVYGDTHNVYNAATQTYGPGRIGINTFNVYQSSCTNISATNNTVYYISSLNNTGATADYGFATSCSPTTENNNTAYAVGDTFDFPSITMPRPSCSTLNLKRQTVKS
jgi:hypothetical protein